MAGPMKHRIAIFNLNETRRDPRVRRVAETLRKLGHEVRVFEMMLDGLSEHEKVSDLNVQRVPIPNDYRSEAMEAIRMASPKAAGIIESCHPAVMRHETRFMRLSLMKANFMEELNRRRCKRLGKPDAPRRNVVSEILAIRSILLINLELFRAAKKFAPTFVIANDLDTLLAAYMLHDQLGVKILFDAHEVYPEQLSYEMRSEFWHAFYTALEKKLVRFIAGGMTVCESIADYFAYQYKAPGFVTVLNVPTIRLQPDPSILQRHSERRRILYHGAYFQYRGLDEVIEASRFVDNADFVFRGIGAYEKELKALAARVGVEDRVRFELPVPVFELIPTASQCDIGLNPFINVCKNSEFALPNKFFEYMMAGLALASSDLVEMRLLTQKLDNGTLFPSLQPKAIAYTLNEMLARPDQIDQMRVNSYEAARTTFNWESEEKKFVSFFEKLSA
jgi:glycogen(starch) synthase